MAVLIPRFASFICLLAVGCTALTVDRFIPFGTDKGDTIFFSNDDNTTSIAVPVRFPFYDRLFTTIHINNNGLLSFEAAVRDYTPRDFPLKADDSVRGVGVAFIAPFWADVDTRDGHGTVFFRSSTNPTTLALIKDVVSSSQAGADLAARFNPIWALVATWEEVGYYDRKGDMQNNTFQVVVITDGLFSFTIFNYAKLTWVTGDDVQSGGTNGFGGTAAMVGINAGDGINFKKFTHSLTDRVVEVLDDTNMRDCDDPALNGQYVYQIDTVPIFDERRCKDPSRPPIVLNPCLPATIKLSPSFGAVHTGGFVIVTGPKTNLFFSPNAAARIQFGEDGEELNCNFKKGRPTLICPVPLFPPDGAGMKVVTLTVSSFTMCTYKGRYRVDPPQPFMEGNLMMTMEDDYDCDIPLSKPVFTTGDRFCLTWKAKEHFARDQVGPFQNDSIEVNVTLHYLSPNTTLANHGEDSKWKSIDLDRLFYVELHKESKADFRPLLIDEAAIVTLLIGPEQPEEFSTPVPVLMFFKVSIIGAGINVFTSSPLVSFLPKAQHSPQTSSTRAQCDNIIPSLETAHDRLPCPATLSLAFLDPSLVVDSGCLMNPAHPNKMFNCHLNPGVQQCFRQRMSSRPDDIIVGQCCYDNNVLVTVPNQGGRDTKSDPKNSFFEHFSKDLWPIIVCCEEIKSASDENCLKILNEGQKFFAKSFARGYSAPQVGMLFGDPHFRTFDGRSYTFNGLGEYVLVNAMDGEFVIQIRTAVASNNINTELMGTSISAVAAQQVGGDPIQLEFNERFGVSVYINGTRVSFLEEQEQAFSSFSISHQLNGTANVTFTNGVVLSATGSNEILDVILTIPTTFKNHTKGLLGTWNDNPDDDFLTSSGTTLPPNATEEELFRGFGQTWMVTDADSLFFYRPGESTSTINQPDFEPTFGMPDIPDELRTQIEEQCGGQRECIYDAAVTGNVEIGISTMSRGNEFAQRQAEAIPPVCDPECQNGGECILNDTCSCTSEFTGPTCEDHHQLHTQLNILLPSDIFLKRTDDRLTESTVLTAPLLIDEEVQDEFGRNNISLCYQVHGQPGKFFSLISDACVSVNVRYRRQTGSPSAMHISDVGIIGIDDNDTCVTVELNANGCALIVNNETILTNYELNGLIVTKLTDGARITLPNCEFRDIFITAMCKLLTTTGQPSLELSMSRMLNFRATSHGILGQFWNVPVMLTQNPFNLTYGGFILPTYNVTVENGDRPSRTFTAYLYEDTWNTENEPCLYSGDGQAGPSILEGNYLDYQVADMFDTNFRFSRFRAGYC